MIPQLGPVEAETLGKSSTCETTTGFIMRHALTGGRVSVRWLVSASPPPLPVAGFQSDCVALLAPTLAAMAVITRRIGVNYGRQSVTSD